MKYKHSIDEDGNVPCNSCNIKGLTKQQPNGVGTDRVWLPCRKCKGLKKIKAPEGYENEKEYNERKNEQERKIAASEERFENVRVAMNNCLSIEERLDRIEKILNI